MPLNSHRANGHLTKNVGNRHARSLLLIGVLLGVALFGAKESVMDANNTKQVLIYDAQTKTYVMVDKIVKSSAEWKKILTPEQFRVTREHGTERAFCGLPVKGRAQGVYQCVNCGTDLFLTDTKFESGTGWPSFWLPIDRANVGFQEDNEFGMRRTEAHCARCDAHLGHVFDDGPPPTHKRYCINSVALKFVSTAKEEVMENTQKATFAGGCFWCMQPFFDRLKGVKQTLVGYTGGETKDPTYEQISNGNTGHAEAIEIVYDPQLTTYARLLDIYWRNIDPTAVDHQFVDYGTQYRSAIFYHDAEQKRIAQESKAKLGASGRFDKPIATQITAAATFYPAEDYHQQYYKKSPARYNMYHDNSGRDEFLEKKWAN